MNCKTIVAPSDEELDFAKQKTEGENGDLKISLPPSKPLVLPPPSSEGGFCFT